MIWTALGHAMWLVEAAANRVLFDPLLGEHHHQGVFRVFPPRDIEVEALAPDLVVVTHRHPDHFDLLSLTRLVSTGALLVTPDPLVALAGERLGYEVCLLPLGQSLPLDGATLLPTPSYCHVVEWGMLVATEEGVAWNQVDTELRSPADVRAVLAGAASTLGCPSLAEGPDLGVVRWQPLREVEPFLGRPTGFPYDAYRRQLEIVAATGQGAVIPGASGSAYADGGLDHLAFPVSERRFLADLARRCPGRACWSARPGDRWEVARGVRRLEPAPWVRLREEPDPRDFKPWSLAAVPEEPAPVEPVARWVHEVLAPALARAWHELVADGPLRFALDAVGAGAWTVRAGPDGARVHSGFEPDYDAAVRISAGSLLDVIEGRSHWGTALLGGRIRATTRAYRITPSGMAPLKVAPIFLYYALPYEEAFGRWVMGWLDRHAPSRPSQRS